MTEGWIVESRNHVPRRTQIAKRLIDVIGSTTLLMISLVPMSMSAVAIYIDSGSPIIFRQYRLGRYQRHFEMLKFRTMVVGAQDMGTGLFSYSGDPRVTRVGRILREISVDEAPQLINVWKGDMSLVGPRPPVVGELGPESGFDSLTRRRFIVRPGITGLAQVSGRNELGWDEKIAYDNQYVDLLIANGVRIDLWIIAKSIVTVVHRRGIIEQEA